MRINGIAPTIMVSPLLTRISEVFLCEFQFVQSPPVDKNSR
jgi:hypothetical protein